MIIDKMDFSTTTTPTTTVAIKPPPPPPASNKSPVVLEETLTPEQKMKLLREEVLSTHVDLNSLKKYKPTDFRRQLVLKQLKNMRRFSRMSKMAVTIPLGPQPKAAAAISVDTKRSSSNTDVVRLVLKELGWREYPSGKRSTHCDICWNSVNFYENPSLGTGYVNKFPGIGTLMHKVNFSRTLDIMQQLFPDDYSFYPVTWYLPHQLPEFSAHVRSSKSSQGSTPTYIVKPDEGSQGEGIYLIREPNDYRLNNKNHIVQEYLPSPLLIDGFKFDLRVYVVIKSLMPLEIYVCKEGMARFCTESYQRPTARNLNMQYMHLTNYSLNKHSANYVHSDTEDLGSKRTLSSVFHQMDKLGHPVSRIWRDIESMITKTVLAFTPELKVYQLAETPAGKPGPSCFQILGFDVLILEDFRPILLEVNSNPSLRLDTEVDLAPGIPEYFVSPVDVIIKKPLVRDTLKLMKKAILRKRRRPTVQSELVEERPLSVINSASDYLLVGSTSETSADGSSTVEDGSIPIFNRQQTDMAIESSTIPSGGSSKDNYGRGGFDTSPNEYNMDDAAGEDVSFSDSSNDSSAPLKTKKSLVIPLDGSPFETYIQGDVQYTVSGTSPQIRQKQRHLRAQQMKREKIWLQPDNSKGGGSGDEPSSEWSAENPSGTSTLTPGLSNSVIMEEQDEEQEYPGMQRSSRGYEIPHFNLPGRVMIPFLNGEEEEENCLQELYPARYADSHYHLRILEQTTEIFIAAIGVRTNFKMGSTAFRAFARKCQLSQLGFSSATIDIIFIDLQRRWDYIYQDGGSGLCFQAFLEAFFKIAFTKFNKNDKLYAIRRMINHCRIHMGLMTSNQGNPESYDKNVGPDTISSFRNRLSGNTTTMEGLQAFVQQTGWRRDQKKFQTPTLSAGFRTSLLPRISAQRSSLTFSRDSGRGEKRREEALHRSGGGQSTTKPSNSDRLVLSKMSWNSGGQFS